MREWAWLIYILMPFSSLGQEMAATRDSFSTIEWDQSSLKKVAPLTGNKSANYARIIQLHNGNLLCVYETAGGVECSASTDLGSNWLKPVIIAAAMDGINMSVPEILELKDHSLLASYNPRPRKINGVWNTTKHFSIRTKKSYDQGKTWQDERLIYQAGYNFEDGCWEPAQIQLPSGEIRLYFSDEAIYTSSGEQNISLLRSFDNGLSWSSKAEIISFTPGHRDGMPVPLILQGTGEIVFSIEDNSSGQFKPSIIQNIPGKNRQTPIGANDKDRSSAIVPALPDTVYAGAPYLRQLQSGYCILSYQSTINRASRWDLSCMQVAVGDSVAKGFKNVATPFDIPLDKYGLWNSLCVLADHTIIAVTSTNAFTDNTSIWMIKGRLINKRAD